MSARSPSNVDCQVAVIGGGLAGIAAATALISHGFRVQLYEARNQLGGRAGSYHDQGSSELIDNCQHVSMGCCTNLEQLCRVLGIERSFETQTVLNFVSPDGRIIQFSESALPAPFHLTLSFLKLPYLSRYEKYLFATAVKKLARTPESQLRGLRFANWLRAQKQTEQLIRRVWEVVLVSALSESLERIDAAYGRKVFVDGFLANREGWRVQIPTESLDELYSNQTVQKLRSLGVKVQLQHRLQTLSVDDGRVLYATFTNDVATSADEFVLAVPHHQVSRLLPDAVAQHPSLAPLENLETAPITSVHLWLDRCITELPHAVFVDRMSQWLFARPVVMEDTETLVYRYQIVISASRNLARQSQSEIVTEVMRDLGAVWPVARSAVVLHSRIVTEKRAVFSVTPGVDELRPSQQTFLPNLNLAGDWTQTGWPATMEGAVRSGYLAADNILRRYGITDSSLASDLRQGRLCRWLFGLQPG